MQFGHTTRLPTSPPHRHAVRSRLPRHDSFLISSEFRAQFNGLFDLIQTIPVGPQGPQGVPGPAGTSVTGAVVDSVTTAGPLDPAVAAAFSDGAQVHFTSSIPRGTDGSQGMQGNNGNDGLQGPQGNQGMLGEPGPVGPPFTSFVIDTVTTLPPGQAATVQAVFDGASVRFSFGIPQGMQGSNGSNGADGQQGATGAQGRPFTSFVVDEVTTLGPGQPATVQTSFDGTNVHFTFSIPRGSDGMQGPPGPQDLSGTAVNPTIANLALIASDPPTQAELQQVVDKLNELMTALRRLAP